MTTHTKMAGLIGLIARVLASTKTVICVQKTCPLGKKNLRPDIQQFKQEKNVNHLRNDIQTAM